MRNQLSAYIDNLITVLILAVVALTPLVFAPLATEFFDIPKVIFLSFTVLVLLVLWSLSWVLKGKVTFARTPFDLPLVLLLLVIILSTIFSQTQNISILGNLPKVHGSAVAWVAYILFYFIATSHLRTQGQVKTVFYALTGSAVLVAVVSLLSYFGFFLPISFAKTAGFNPTGSSFSAAALMVLLLPVLILSIINKQNFFVSKNKFLHVAPALVLATFFGITIALIGDLATRITVLVVVCLTFFVARQKQIMDALPYLTIPVIVSLLVFGFSTINIASNPLQQKAVNFPKEIQLPFSTSWKVSASAFRDQPFLGSGPSTYLFNFTNYKPAEFNSTKFWNIKFDTSFNEYLQALGTVGGLGFMALVFLSVVVLGFAWKGLADHENVLVQGLSVSAIASVVLLTFHVSTPVVIVAILSILAMLMAIHKSTSGKVEELSIGIKASKITDSSLIIGDILPIILFIPAVILALIALWQGSRVVLADYYHRQALNTASTNALQTYNQLVQAETLNPAADLYRVDLAQTNFALANAIASSKGPTESSPSGSLTDQDKQNIQTLLSQAINEGRAATTLSPRNAQNWEILASIYRQISGVAQNALQFSLDSYGRAIQQDPLNPALRLNVGGVYYSIKNYDLAIRFFTDAANLKPDYANAYYNLSVAMRDKGDLQSAQATAEKVLTLLSPDSQDYQTAANYLADLKARSSTGSANQSALTAPAAQQNSALQKDSLPKVLDLPKPDKVSTPPAIKKRSSPTSTP